MNGSRVAHRGQPAAGDRPGEVAARCVRLAGIGAAISAMAWSLTAGSAAASVTIGQTSSSFSTQTTECQPRLWKVQKSTVSPAGLYAAPSDGVVTSWSTLADGFSGEQARLRIFRDLGAGRYFVVGQSDVMPLTPHGLTPFPTRIAVRAGDLLALDVPTSSSRNVLCSWKRTGVTEGDVEVYGTQDASPGNTVTNGGGGTNVNERINVSAILEPDADGDGFGDESQDRCPGVPGSLQGCPKADLSISKVASGVSVFGGQNVRYTLTARNNGPDAAPNVVVSDALPAGASLISAVPSTGTCKGTSCNVGALASGATATVTVLVSMGSLGAMTDRATIDSPTLDQAAKNAIGAGDPNPANNSASVTTTVFAPAFVGASVISRSLAVKHGSVTVSVTLPSAGSGTLALSDVINPGTGRVLSAKKKKHNHRKTLVLGTAPFSIGAGQTKQVTIHLSSRALKLLKKNRSTKATLTAVTTDLFGTKMTTRSKVTLKLAKKHGH